MMLRFAESGVAFRYRSIMSVRKRVLPAPELPIRVIVPGQSRRLLDRFSSNTLVGSSPMYISRCRYRSKFCRMFQYACFSGWCMSGSSSSSSICAISANSCSDMCVCFFRCSLCISRTPAASDTFEFLTSISCVK